MLGSQTPSNLSNGRGVGLRTTCWEGGRPATHAAGLGRPRTPLTGKVDAQQVAPRCGGDSIPHLLGNHPPSNSLQATGETPESTCWEGSRPTTRSKARGEPRSHLLGSYPPSNPPKGTRRSSWPHLLGLWSPSNSCNKSGTSLLPSATRGRYGNAGVLVIDGITGRAPARSPPCWALVTQEDAGPEPRKSIHMKKGR